MAMKKAAPKPVRPSPGRPSQPGAPPASTGPGRPPGKPPGPPGRTPGNPPAPVAKGVSQEVFDAYCVAATEALEALQAQLNQVRIDITGYAPYVAIGDDGMLVLDIESAPREVLRDWAYQFGFSSVLDDPTEKIRAFLIKTRDRAGFAGFEAVNTLPAPEEGKKAAPAKAPKDAPVAPAPEDEDEGEDGEEDETITEDEIKKMNWSALVELADRCEIDYSDIAKPPKPKVLRNRILEALTAEDEPGDAGGDEPEPESVTFEKGDRVTIKWEGTDYPGVFQGEDGDGDALVELDSDGSTVAVPLDTLTTA